MLPEDEIKLAEEFLLQFSLALMEKGHNLAREISEFTTNKMKEVYSAGWSESLTNDVIAHTLAIFKKSQSKLMGFID